MRHPVASSSTRQLTRRSRTNFYYAFVFLPREQREALDAVYSFCRLVDDAADDAPSASEAKRRLTAWRRALDRIFDERDPLAGEDDVLVELRRAIRRFPIRREDLEAVIEGCEWDATRNRYQTWDELRAYCRRVASAVGLCCIEIFGYRDPRARDYAVDLGLALQLTNILRDVDEDAGRGRIYLPLEDLRDFGVAESELLAGRRTPPVMRLLRFEAGRARMHFLRARAAIGPDERAKLVVAEIMGDIYYGLLEALERRGFPADKRIALSSAKKARLALGRFLWAQLPSGLNRRVDAVARGASR